MASFNKVLLMGNLTRDPELRYTASGAAVASFGLAVNRKFKQGEEWKDEVCFVDITVWAKQGENCAQYLNKGSLVFLEGRLNYQTWEADGGQKRSKLEDRKSTRLNSSHVVISYAVFCLQKKKNNTYFNSHL